MDIWQTKIVIRQTKRSFGGQECSFEQQSGHLANKNGH